MITHGNGSDRSHANNLQGPTGSASHWDPPCFPTNGAAKEALLRLAATKKDWRRGSRILHMCQGTKGTGGLKQHFL